MLDLLRAAPPGHADEARRGTGAANNAAAWAESRANCCGSADLGSTVAGAATARAAVGAHHTLGRCATAGAEHAAHMRPRVVLLVEAAVAEATGRERRRQVLMSFSAGRPGARPAEAAWLRSCRRASQIKLAPPRCLPVEAACQATQGKAAPEGGAACRCRSARR